MPSPIPACPAAHRTWPVAEVEALLSLPFNDLMYLAQQVHRARFDPNRVQVSTLLSIKTGACPEDCAYCSQSAQHETGLARGRLLPLQEVIAAASAARDQGATRFCMGAAWRNPTDRNLDQVVAMIAAVHDLGLETCVTLGMLTGPQAERLKAAGLDYYNHNLDTSPEFYGQVITTRTYQDRLDTLAEVQRVGLKVCSGGILGWGSRGATAPACFASSPTCRSPRSPSPSTCWSRWRGPRFTARPLSILSIWSAPWLPRAS
jgi:biotin synthase